MARRVRWGCPPPIHGPRALRDAQPAVVSKTRAASIGLRWLQLAVMIAPVVAGVATLRLAPTVTDLVLGAPVTALQICATEPP